MATRIEVRKLKAWFGEQQVLQGIDLVVPAGAVTAIVGPSGCGKSTLVRCLNRMHEVTPGARASGQVVLDLDNIYAPWVDPVQIRARVGMVFQRPNPFPTMSIFDNVAAGWRLNGDRSRRTEVAAMVERSLRQAALWDEVKANLHAPGASLSGGQQQRLCIARALAVKPNIILMDEPCSALDPIATAKIEELIRELREAYTIVIVTHNMQQAARVSDYTALLYLGDPVEFGPTDRIFTAPEKKETEDYVTGRFG